MGLQPSAFNVIGDSAAHTAKRTAHHTTPHPASTLQYLQFVFLGCLRRGRGCQGQSSIRRLLQRAKEDTEGHKRKTKIKGMAGAKKMRNEWGKIEAERGGEEKSERHEERRAQAVVK